MNVRGRLPISDNHGETRVFISYATANRKGALSVCEELERRGQSCWISTRDVPPGENYQEAIVRAIRGARAMVLIFSEAANQSDEIKKELSLASRHNVPVIAVRIENVEPSDAFAYELSTRQWIDAFDRKSKAMEALAHRLVELRSEPSAPTDFTSTAAPRMGSGSRRVMAYIGAGLALVAIAILGWWNLSPKTTAAHSMVVRLSGFRILSTDLPATMPDTVREEVIAAFGDDGVIRVSTASAVEAGKGPAYSLGGTIRREGNEVRVITRLTNDRSGATLWSDSFDYDADQIRRIPRRIAVDAGNMVHCGLFAASTYHKPLADAVMSDFMQFCQNSWWSQQFSNPEKALDAARKVAAAAPDFSWGWSAITVAAQLVFYQTEPGPHREEIRNLGLSAADKALAIDPKNSEAYAQKSMLIGRNNWAAQERLLNQAIIARPLFCGCEHYLYGVMLKNVGRFEDASREMRRSTEMLALDGISQFGLADTLLVLGEQEEAKTHFDHVVDLFRSTDTKAFLTVQNAPETRDFADALKALDDPRFRMSSPKRAAIRSAYRALAGGTAADKHAAADALNSLPLSEQGSSVVRLLGALGANSEALKIVERRMAREDFSAASWLWYPSMRAALSDAEVPRLIQRFGLLDYWKKSRSRPDACNAKDPPPFCRMI